MRRLPLVILALAIVIPSAARAQQSDRDAVVATVQKVFDAMRTRDTSLLRQAFDSAGHLVSVGRTGAVSLMPYTRFGAAVAGAKSGDVWNERIYDPEVRIDGDVAQVWAYYTFHLNDTFSHCGIDAFMLVKANGTWRITQLADSRRTQGCTHTTP